MGTTRAGGNSAVTKTEQALFLLGQIGQGHRERDPDKYAEMAASDAFSALPEQSRKDSVPFS
jgi:hypothetical protein